MFPPTSMSVFVACLRHVCMYVVCSPYRVDKEVQLVCKYLHAFQLKDNKVEGINRLHDSMCSMYSICSMCSMYSTVWFKETKRYRKNVTC